MYEIIVTCSETGSNTIVDKKHTKRQADDFVKYMLDKGMVEERNVYVRPTGRDKRRLKE